MAIKRRITDTRVPVKIWADEVEDAALEQLRNIASLPFVFKHVAAMPDVHLGKGATVGSVVATKGAVCPAAVGVDIGCGMMAVRLEVEPARVLDILPKIRHSIERSIPVGFSENKEPTERVLSWDGWKSFEQLSVPIQVDKAQRQLGTLGGGNHFIEVCLDSKGSVWIMLHSGSRNTGNVVASRHIEKAKGIIKQMFISLPDPDLAYFAQGTQEFKNYIHDLHWCQDYALENRKEMMRRVLKDISYAIGERGAPLPQSIEVNCHHNYAAFENHSGENVLVTRKGAVRARVGDLGIIPGSMGTRSYIVQGLGNPESFHSCSHGAGRRMSRNEARRRFTVDDLMAQTSGVECRKDEAVLDEIPGAYKDIDEVMANQSDLVEVVAELKQVLCVKG